MPISNKDEGFPIVLAMPTQGVKETFRDGANVVQFFQEEARLWREIGKPGSPHPLVGTHVANIAGQQAATDALSKLGAAVDAATCYRAVARYEGERPVIMQGTIGKLALDREGETPAQTSGFLWAAAAMLGSTRLLQLSNHAVPLQDLAAIMFGQAKLTNGLQKARSERANLQRLTQTFGDEIGRAKVNNDSIAAHLAKSTIELDGVIARSTEDTAKLLEETGLSLTSFSHKIRKQASVDTQEFNKTLSEAVRTSTEEIEAFKRKVRIDVGLEEPTNFWTEKADGHRLTAAIFGALFLSAVVGMVLWIDGYAIDLVAEAVDRIVGNRESAALSLVPVAFITVPALAFAWVLRHLSRIIIQNLSLEADARLRGTITRTFKALAADRAMNDAELAIALQALFRPIDGKDHSEIAPPSLGDILKLGGENKH